MLLDAATVTHIKRISILFTLLQVFIAYSASASDEAGAHLKYFQKDVRYDYRNELLLLALEKATGKKNYYTLQPINQKVTQARGLQMLEKGSIDFVSLGTSSERESRFLPIRFPILNGLLGYRVLLIHKDSTADFAEIRSLGELQSRFKAGFGAHWGDLKILQANELQVETSAVYNNLFNMLAKKRYDYFPRGINEAWKEIEELGSTYPDLVIESSLALHYPFPVYFFVKKGNTHLANLIETGLNKALKDRSLERLFFKYHLDTISKANLSKRHIFELSNPYLPENTQRQNLNWITNSSLK